ncbi:MAG TPA: hypothetical protein VHK28_05685 [Candidatus Limnocylindria bacterium]|nr:hypothetical protein [Candidatus Limnocylindria bacterium]
MAGTILIVFGSLLAAVGAVLLVLSFVFSSDAPLPAWIAVDPLVVDPGTGLLLLGLALMTIGVSQVVAGVAAMTRGLGWARPAGIGLALPGAGAATWALLPLEPTPSVQLIFVPVIAAYLFVVLAEALAPDWFRG